MRKVMLVFGTRPEAIKMCPLVKEMKKREAFKTLVCVTGQHREMLDQVLACFQITPDYSLDIMRENQTLFDITAEVLRGMEGVLRRESPDLVLVHGDTSTAFASALACFYLQIPVGHVEAGLRTYRLDSPFPEEFNRQGVGLIARYHFAPTEKAKQNLLREGKPEPSIFITGNTAIDALQDTVKADYRHPVLDWAAGSRLILLTAHRRENNGGPFHHIFRAVKRIAEDFPDVKIVYPVHLNPAIRKNAREFFGDAPRIKLIEPLNVLDFHNFMARSYLILTDSGGIQEEAPALGIPVLVLRDTTERPEGVEAGTLKLVGSGEEEVYAETKRLLTDPSAYRAMACAANPYGDGTASRQIADVLSKGLLES